VRRRIQHERLETLSPTLISAARKGATSVSTVRPSPEETLALVLARLDEDQAAETIQIDLQGKPTIADYMVVTSGRSHRHVGAIAEHLVQALDQSRSRDRRSPPWGEPIGGITPSAICQGHLVHIDARLLEEGLHHRECIVTVRAARLDGHQAHVEVGAVVVADLAPLSAASFFADLSIELTPVHSGCPGQCGSRLFRPD
jgi:hypothetical protein